MCINLGSAAREACASIVKHYSDPIHYASSLPSASEAGGSEDVDAAQQSNAYYDSQRSLVRLAPYFDTNLGYPMPDLAPVCGFWYRRLLLATNKNTVASSLSEASNTTTSLDAAQELLCCYESIIHPCLRRRKSPKVIDDDNDELERSVPFNAVVEILRNYELLLAHFMRDASTVLSASGGTTATKRECNNNVTEVISEVSNGRRNNNVDGGPVKEILESDDEKSSLDVKRIVLIIAEDTFQWSTKLPRKDVTALWKVQNVLLPCLLRLIEHIIVFLTLHKPDTHHATTSDTHVQEALAIATVAAVPFVGDGKLKSGVFGIGSLLDWVLESTDDDCRGNGSSMPSQLSLAHTLQNCSLSPTSKGEESNATYLLPDSVMASNFMTRPVLDWSVPSAHFDALWTDGVAGIGSRVAMALLRTIQKFSCRMVSPSTEEAEGNDGNDTNSARLLLRKISQKIGTDVLVSAVRAHFFGRLSNSCSNPDANAIVQPRASGVFMPMVKRIGANSNTNEATKSASSDEKPHIDIPMRIAAAAIIVCAAVPQSCNKFEVWNKACSDTLPIAMSLLDDVQSIHQAIGALLFVSVVETAFSYNPEEIPSFVEKFSSLVTSSFEGAIQMCGREEPTVLTMICLAQSKWIKYLGSYSHSPETAITPSEVQTMARKAAADILMVIGKQTQIGGRDGNDERIAGALVGGINPLLAQLAEFPEAASVEIARVGLSTILPLIGWSGMSLEVRTAQVSALAGLISLMNGAYPIMPHHGKKIMTEVFLLLDRADKDAACLNNNKRADSIAGTFHDDEVSTDATSRVALYTADIALAICGKSAETVLAHIESTQSRELLLKRCREIRETSEQLACNGTH